MPASFLRCRNFTIRETKRHNGRTCFTLDDSPQLRQAVIDFADGTDAVRTFSSTIRDLKVTTR
jgi:hypothetical protein